MKKSSTPKLYESKEKVVAPSVSTIDFLKQFARSYYVDKSLPKAFSGLYMN